MTDKFSKNQILSFLTNNPTLGLKPIDILKIEEITDVGILNYNYRIETKKNLFILKQFLKNPKSNLLKNLEFDPEERIKISFYATNIFADALKPVLVVPPVLYYDRKNNFLIFKGISNIHSLRQEFVEGQYNPHLLTKVGKILAKMHNYSYKSKLPRKIDLKSSSVLNLRLKYHFLEIAKLVDNKTAKVIRELAKTYKKRKEVLVHGDFQPNNIFIKNKKPKKVYVIDCEMAHMGTPAFDLGHLLSEYIIFRENNPSKRGIILNDLKEFRKEYFKNSISNNFLKIENESVKHIGVQIIFRLYGYTKENFTAYVKEESVKKNCKELALLMLNKDLTLKELLEHYL